MSDDRTYAISAANLEVLEQNLNYLATNVEDVDVRVEDVNNKVNKVTEEVRSINDSIRDLITEIRETTILTNAKQSISLAQDEINKRYGHYDSIRRQISGLFQAIEVGSIDKKGIKSLKEKALIDTPDYWLSSAFVAICAWLNDNKEECVNALKDAIKKDDEKTSLFFSLINLKYNRYSSSFMWLKRYLDMQDASKMENKVVPLLDTLTSGIFNEEEKEYFLNKITLWTNELGTKSNYKNIQINRWVDFLVYLLGEKNYDEYYYVKNYTNKYAEINKLTNINVSQRNIFYQLTSWIDEKEDITLNKKDQIDSIINLLIYNYENDELDLRKDIAKNKLIVEENGNTSRAKEKFKMTEFSYLKNTDFYSILSNIVLQSDELKPSINTKKLSLSLLKELILNSYEQLNDNTLDNLSIMIKINNFTGSTIDGKNEKELVTSLHNLIDKESSLDIESVKLFDIKMIFTLVFGFLCSVILCFVNMASIGVIIALATMAMLIYSFSYNYKARKNKINKREQRKKEETDILMNVIAEIVDFRFIIKDGIEIKNKITTLLKSLDYNNYIKTNETRNINIEKKEGKIEKSELFDEKNKEDNKINPPKWEIEPPYENVRTVIR